MTVRQKHVQDASEHTRSGLMTQLHRGIADAGLALTAWALALFALWQLAGVPPVPGYELSICVTERGTFLPER
jgi:hypothetical protein